MRTSLRPTLSNATVISRRADFEHAHVRALGELRLDLGRLETNRPGGRRQGVGHARWSTSPRSERSRSTWLPLPEICARDLGQLLLQGAAGWELQVEPELEVGGHGLLQLHRDVQHQGQEDCRALDRPVPREQLNQVSAHRAAADEALVHGAVPFRAPITFFTITPSRSITKLSGTPVVW